MSKLKDMRYKDEKPEKTVERLKKILKEHGIEVEENWTKPSSVNTYSLRLCIKGTNLGQNGKGMTKEYAMASAYAEFFERYQNGILVFREEKPNSEFPFMYAADEVKLTSKQLAEEENTFLEKILEDNEKQNLNKQEKEIFFKELFGENLEIVNLPKEHISIPYYSVKNKNIVHLPHVLSCHLCGTNGMCAGNTPEEAIIEGICEILERYVSMRLFYDKPSLPEVSEEYLEKFPKVKNMLNELKENEEYVCKLLDCSFGGKYPVAGLMIIQKNTGKFGFKLGSHPDYGIAMERCFTEAAQGMDIYEYAQGCLFDFKNEDICKDENVREFVNSNVATLPYILLDNEKTYEFSPMPDVSDKNNKQILDDLVNNILDDGKDILIRDVSVFGFPSFRIIIPGMTEVTHTPMASRFAMFEALENLLKDFRNIHLGNIEEVINMMKTQIEEVGFTTLSTFINVKDVQILPCENIGMGAQYFLAMCYVMNKQYDEAEKILENIMFVAENMTLNPVENIFIKAVYYYVSAMNKLNNHEKTMYYMNILFDEDIVECINQIFKNPEEILINHYALEKQDYVENDDSYYLPFMKELKKVQKENVINQMKNKAIFEK